MNDPFYRSYEEQKSTPQYSPPEPPQIPVTPPSPAVSLCRALSAAVGSSFVPLLIGHIMLCAIDIILAAAFFIPAPNPMYHPSGYSGSSPLIAAGLIVCAATHTAMIIADIMLMRSGENKKTARAALVICSVSKFMHLLSWTFTVATPLINTVSGVKSDSPSAVYFTFLVIQDIPVAALALSIFGSLESSSFRPDVRMLKRFTDFTVILNIFTVFAAVLYSFFASAKGFTVLFALIPVIVIAVIVLNFSIAKIMRAPGLQGYPTDFGDDKQPLTERLTRFFSGSLRSLVTGHILLAAAAVVFSIACLTPVHISFDPPGDRSHAVYLAGLIPCAVSHLIAIAAERIMARSDDSKARLCRGLVLFSVSRLLHLLSWIAIISFTSISGLPFFKGRSLTDIILAVMICVVIALIFYIQDIPLGIFALRAKRDIKKDSPALSVTKGSSLFFNGAVYFNTFTLCIMMLSFVLGCTAGDITLTIICLPFIIGTLLIQLTFIRLSQEFLLRRP